MHFGVSVGSLSSHGWVCVAFLFVIWVMFLALGAAGSWVMLTFYLGRGLGENYHNTAWDQECFGGLASWTQDSHPRGSDLTSNQGTKTPQPICHGNKEDFKNKNKINLDKY